MTAIDQNRKFTTLNPNALFFVVAGLIVIATFAVYWQVHGFEFISFDDRVYVTQNPRVQNGLTLDSIKWAFTTTYAANWHPLTWLSLILDYELYGLNAGGFHITNLIFHLANTVLLFWLFLRMTKTLWPSAFIAALFALHPLHVESVAWIAERKDVLSTFFWFLTMIAYLRYTENKTKSRYAAVIILFALGLMAKPMLVTLPFVLLLMDYWPLNRLGKSSVLEKLPLFVFSVCSSIVTFFAQKSSGAVESVEVSPLWMRFSNAIVAYMSYIDKTIRPIGFSIIYPRQLENIKISHVVIAAFFLIAITIAVIRFRKHRWLPIGWLWYLGTLIPVIGIVQVGNQAIADRYMYVPMIGLSVIIAWGAQQFSLQFHLKRLIKVLATIVIASLALLTWRQVSFWQNGLMLYQHSLAVTKDNNRMHDLFGVELLNCKMLDEAIEQFQQSIKLNPYHAGVYNNLGAAFSEKKDFEQAIKCFREAVKLDPNYADAYAMLASLLAQQGKMEEAIENCTKAVQINKNDAEAHYLLGNLLAGQGKPQEAIVYYEQAVKIRPDYTDAQAKLDKSKAAEAHYLMGNLLAGQKKLWQAMVHYNQALKIYPDYVDAQTNRDKLLIVLKKAGSLFEQGEIFQKQGNFVEAVNNYRQALDLVNDSPTTLNNLAWLLATNSKVRNPAEAVSLAEQAAKLTNYNQPEILDTLAAAYAANNDFAKAVETAQKAVDLAKSSNKLQLAENINSHLELYKKGTAYVYSTE